MLALVSMVFDDRPAHLERRRVVIGWTPAGLPRTYRIASRRSWHGRLAAKIRRGMPF
jgi:hypothetical protein